MRTRASYLANKFVYQSRAQNKHDRIWYGFVQSNVNGMIWRFNGKLIAISITNYIDNSQALRIMDHGNRRAPVIHRLNALLARLKLGEIAKINKCWCFTQNNDDGEPDITPWAGTRQFWIKPPDKTLRRTFPSIEKHILAQLNQYPPGSYQLNPPWKKSCNL